MTGAGKMDDKIREALLPFARIAEEYDCLEGDAFEIWQDAHVPVTRITLGQCRAASAALDSIAAISTPPAERGEETDRENEQFNKGVLHTVDLLAKALGVENYVAGDGSEDYDTDLTQTLLNILEAKGLYDKDECTFATPPAQAEIGEEEIVQILKERLSIKLTGLTLNAFTLHGTSEAARDILAKFRNTNG